MAKDLMDAMTFDAKEVVNCRKQIEVTIPADVVSAEAEKAPRLLLLMSIFPVSVKAKLPSVCSNHAMPMISNRNLNAALFPPLIRKSLLLTKMF